MDKELLWPNFSHLGKASSGNRPLRKWCKPLRSAQVPELCSVTLESKSQGRDSDETTTSTSSGFSSTPTAQRQAQTGKQMITIFRDCHSLESNGRPRGEKDSWAHTFSIWKLFVKSWRDRQGQSPAVLRILKYHPGTSSSPKHRPQHTRGHMLVLGHVWQVLSCSLCATSISPKQALSA